MCAKLNPDITQYKFDGFKFDVSWKSKYNMSKFHSHQGYELYFLIDGNCKYFIGNSLYTISTNEMILIRPHTLHKTLYDTTTNKRISINLATSFIPEEMLAEIDELFKSNVYIPQKPEDILSILKKITHELSNGDSYSQLLVKGYVYELLSILLRNKSKPTASTNEHIDTSVDLLITYIREHLSEDLTLASAAKYTSFSVSHLSKLFLKSTGVGFKEYVQSLRLEKAQELLGSTNMSVNEVSSLCGFNDSNYFSKFFKDHTGISPLKYRKMTKSQ